MSPRGQTPVARLLAGGVGTTFWLGLGAFVGWASVYFEQRWQAGAGRHGELLAGFVLCIVVAAIWLVASARLIEEIRWRLAEQRGAAPGRPRSAVSLLLAPLAAPIVGMIVAVSSSGSTLPGSTLAASGRAPTVAVSARPAATTSSSPAAASTARDNASPPPAAARSHSYVVRPGDSLVAIAERFYGSAEDWTLIAAANLGRPEPGGASFVDPTVLHAGWHLELPAVAEPHRLPGPLAQTLLPGATLGAPSAPPPPPALSTRGGGDRAGEIGAAPALRDPLVLGDLAALGALGALLFAGAQRRRRRLQLMRATPGAGPPAGRDARRRADAALEASGRPLETAYLPALLDTATRLLSARLGECEPSRWPCIGAVRVDGRGVELLLERAAGDPPKGLLSRAEGLSWFLPVSVDLHALAAKLAGEIAYLPVLVPLGQDAGSSYLLAAGAGEHLSVQASDADLRRLLAACALHLDNAEWGEVELFRLGPCSFPGHELAEEVTIESLASVSPPGEPSAGWRLGNGELQPVLLVEDRIAAAQAASLGGPAVVIGPLQEGSRCIRLEGEQALFEPLGLSVPVSLPSLEQAASLVRLRASALVEPELGGAAGAAVENLTGGVEHEPTSALPAVPSEFFPGGRPGAGAAGEPAPAARAGRPEGTGEARAGAVSELLPQRGTIEVRLLRAVPDLVGALRQPPTPAAVQLVAYLAVHGGSAPTYAMRDALGVYRRDQSTREKTIYNAASATRRVLGREHFPLVVGNEPYRLGTEVSCDWLRFEQAHAVAVAARRSGDLEGELEALRFAVGLVGNGQPASDKSLAARFVWLDAELVLEDISYAVLEVAYRLGTLGFGLGDLDLVEHAVDRGRQVVPENDRLRELAMLLTDARGDRAGAAAELDAHVRGVDGLRLGADLSPRIEALASELGLGPLPSWPVRDGKSG